MFCCQAIFFAEYFLLCLFSSFHLFVLCFSIYFLLCSCSTWPLKSVYAVHTNFSVTLRDLYCFQLFVSAACCLADIKDIRGRHLDIHFPSRRRFVPGFPLSYHSLLCYTAWGSEPLVFSIHLQCLDRATDTECVRIGICFTKETPYYGEHSTGFVLPSTLCLFSN